jgi:hypothetical protein
MDLGCAKLIASIPIILKNYRLGNQGSIPGRAKGIFL